MRGGGLPGEVRIPEQVLDESGLSHCGQQKGQRTGLSRSGEEDAHGNASAQVLRGGRGTGLGRRLSRGVSTPLFNSHIMQLSELGPGRRPIRMKSYIPGPEEVSQANEKMATVTIFSDSREGHAD